MSSSLREGLTVRRGRAGDVDAVTAALVAEEVAVRGRSAWDGSDTADWWRALELQGEAWVAEADGGAVAGCLGLFTRGGSFNGWAAVAPEFAGQGLGVALIRLAEERAGKLGGSRLHLGSFAQNAAATRLFEGLGYRVVRHHYRMLIELDERPPPPEWPPGIAHGRFDLADARAVHAAIQEALADDWGFTPMAFEEWQRSRLESPDFDPTLWTVAWEAGEVAGVIRCDPRRWGAGWVGMLGVRRPWRRRGLGLALLRRSFAKFYERGERRVGLGVDAQNPSGATRLYERAGMHVEAEHLTWEKELA
jgi:ribosomal protein S18 acetylase RimI-like enzyme